MNKTPTNGPEWYRQTPARQKEHDMEMVRWPDADMKKAMELMTPLHADYVTRMNDKGLPGQEILDFVKERAAENYGKYPPVF